MVQFSFPIYRLLSRVVACEKPYRTAPSSTFPMFYIEGIGLFPSLVYLHLGSDAKRSWENKRRGCRCVSLHTLQPSLLLLFSVKKKLLCQLLSLVRPPAGQTPLALWVLSIISLEPKVCTLFSPLQSSMIQCEITWNLQGVSRVFLRNIHGK